MFLAERFGIDQVSKIRVIDNGKSCAINQTIRLTERYRLRGIHFLAAFLTWAMMNPRSHDTPILDLNHFQNGEVQICHTEQRIEELSLCLCEILAKNTLDPAEAESLGGGYIGSAPSSLDGALARL